MASVSNPFVDYLNRYTTASPDHEAAFDEFLSQIAPPSGQPLHLKTQVENFLNVSFAQPDPPSVILTGNAGDGKTYLCRQIIKKANEQPFHWERLQHEPIILNGKRLYVIKDLSELGDAEGTALLRRVAATLSGESEDRYLIAANEGRLRALAGHDATLAPLYTLIHNQLTVGEANGARVLVINLTKVTTSSFVRKTLEWMSAPVHWQVCETCESRAACPLAYNARQLAQPSIAARVQMLYQLLEHLDIHVTVRDMLIHLAYTLTANQRCQHLQHMHAAHRDLSTLVYYENIWGHNASPDFQRKASVVQHLERLHIGNHSLFELDNFIVSGGESEEEQAQHRRLFPPAVDLNHLRFEQDRRAYLEVGAETGTQQETPMLIAWLPHCRRKLFFEREKQSEANRLIPFLFLTDYLDLLENEQRHKESIRRNLVLGLNRAFSRLYLNLDDNLYITSQYLHSTEQPRPLVRLTIPIQGVDLRVDRRPHVAYDYDRADLALVIAPPPALTMQRGVPPKPESWRMNLLLFEYLMRLAHGGTFNILAEECELSVRSLKDRLLRAFASDTAHTDRMVEFFVAEQRRYALRKLRIDEQGTIRASY
ncbi:hypothetical protein OSCT_2511 [Oscillochloris trichoides DG-6]|uniref:Uncharacterized protein n=1 Tax=Oscillochloris trichoides DG-6 TaxID=765420 RepID=E1IGR0_9CHLR|nr:hypothetical protein [Oscillochloris trichoides]EFO79647.1 hypothetical protein OSCT_2511 [Oscillochloris trichoides DG-6]